MDSVVNPHATEYTYLVSPLHGTYLVHKNWTRPAFWARIKRAAAKGTA